MIINFDTTGNLRKAERLYWLGVIWKLLEEFDPNYTGLTQQDFQLWLNDMWKIRFLFHPYKENYITGVDIDDESVSMLLLKYQVSDLS